MALSVTHKVSLASTVIDTNKIYYKSDFKLYETSTAGYTVPFVFKYFTDSSSKVYEATFNGTTYDNCTLLSDGRLCVSFDDHGLGLGIVKVERTYYLTDEDFASGVCDEVIAATPVICVADDGTKYYLQLTASGATSIEATAQIPAYYQKGDKGDKGDTGATGADGADGKDGKDGAILYPSFSINSDGHLIAIAPTTEAEMTIELKNGHLIITV